MNQKLSHLMLLGHVLSVQRGAMLFGHPVDNRPVPTPPKTWRDDYYHSAAEGERRNRAAIAKRERRAEKLRKLNP